MEPRKNSIQGLRQSDATTLAVLTQDVLALPLGQFEPGTLMDLIALADAGDQLPGQLAQDLGAFRDRILQQISDIPEGEAMCGFAHELTSVNAELASSSLRDWMAGMIGQVKDEDTLTALQALGAHWEGTAPLSLEIPVASKEAPAPQVVPAKAAPKKKAKRRTATSVDPEKEDFVRRDVLSRLEKYPGTGLKETLMVAGARHRAPWDDLTIAEVMAIVRKMKREGILRNSAGRWLIET